MAGEEDKEEEEANTGDEGRGEKVDECRFGRGGMVVRGRDEDDRADF